MPKPKKQYYQTNHQLVLNQISITETWSNVHNEYFDSVRVYKQCHICHAPIIGYIYCSNKRLIYMDCRRNPMYPELYNQMLLVPFCHNCQDYQTSNGDSLSWDDEASSIIKRRIARIWTLTDDAIAAFMDNIFNIFYELREWF